MDAALLSLALLGHAALCVALVNRTHATGWPMWIIRATTYSLLLFVVALPAAIAWWAWAADPAAPRKVLAGEFLRSAPPLLLAYLVVCWAVAVAIIPAWLQRHVLHRPPDVLRSHDVQSVFDRVSLPPAAGDQPHHFVVHLPRNESLWLDVHHRAIEVPRLPPALDGLSLVHLSDLHFTGRVGKPYFQEIVRHSNALDADLVVLTGDLVDRTRCIDWIPDTLSRLTARYGVFCILGNHDLRADTQRLVRVLQQCGLCYLGGRHVQIEIHGRPVLLAGNELPWIAPAADFAHARTPRQGGPFRIALSHSPDQLEWAQRTTFIFFWPATRTGGKSASPGSARSSPPAAWA